MDFYNWIFHIINYGHFLVNFYLTLFHIHNNAEVITLFPKFFIDKGHEYIFNNRTQICTVNVFLFCKLRKGFNNIFIYQIKPLY